MFERIFVYNFLSLNINICCGCSKEPSHLDGSFMYTQHMFWLRNKKINIHITSMVKIKEMFELIFVYLCLSLSINICCGCSKEPSH